MPVKMSRRDLAAQVAAQFGVPKTKATEIITFIESEIRDTIQSGGEVRLAGFGNFKRRQSKARSGLNPATGEKIRIPAKKSPVFRAAKAWRDEVNGR